MENQRYENLLQRAQENQLSVDDLNEVFLVLHDQRTSEISKLSKEIRQNSRGLQNIEEEYPLLPPEADDLSREVKKKGVSVLGGKNSEAYQDVGLRKRVYQDIYMEIKRNYGLIDEKGIQQSYKKLKRKYFKGAMKIVEEYEPPISLSNEILSLNDIEE